MRSDIYSFFSSDWLREESKGLFGTLGLLVNDAGGVGTPFTLRFTAAASILAAGWADDCEGILTLDEADADFVTMADLARAWVRPASPQGAGAAKELRRLFTKKFFSQLAALTLDHPVSSHPWLIRFSRTDTIFHSALVTDDGRVEVSHTAVYAGGRWNVRPGLVGDVRRIFLLSPDASRDYMMRLRAAQSAVGLFAWFAWLRFLAWYRPWCSRVSKVLGGS